MSDTTAKRGSPTPQGGARTAPSVETETPRSFSVDPKRWTDHRKLDLDLKPEGFVAWHDRALGNLAPERSDIHMLLLWAECSRMERSHRHRSIDLGRHLALPRSGGLRAFAHGSHGLE